MSEDDGWIFVRSDLIMTDGISKKVLERLEAEALTADAEAEELTIAVESDIEQTETEVEELQESLDEKETEIEELQSTVEDKETEIEQLSENIDAVAETYAEELAQNNDVLDADDFLDKFKFEELQEKYDSLEESADPTPKSGDAGAGFQSPEDGPEGGEEEVELSEVEEMAAKSFSERAKRPGKDYWNDIVEDIENAGE